MNNNAWTLDDIKDADPYVYLATPYSDFHVGIDEAAFQASEITAELLVLGVIAFSPISFFHTIADVGNIDPLDSKFWLPRCKRFAGVAPYLLIANMKGWQESKGITEEIKWFNAAGKRIFLLNCAMMTVEKLR